MSINTLGAPIHNLNDRTCIAREVQERLARTGAASGYLPRLSSSTGPLPEDDESWPMPPRTGTSQAPATAPPGTSLSLRSASAPQLDRTATGVTGRSSQRSRRSHFSVASMRSRIEEAVRQEVERTALGDYLALQKEKAQRALTKKFEMPLHLRTGASPIDMGCLPNLVSEAQRGQALPIKMAVDPKWSTELKKMNDRVGTRIEYERRLSASVMGQIAPELPHMYPKRYLSNPPTPFFVPGRRSS